MFWMIVCRLHINRMVFSILHLISCLAALHQYLEGNIYISLFNQIFDCQVDVAFVDLILIERMANCLPTEYTIPRATFTFLDIGICSMFDIWQQYKYVTFKLWHN